MKRKCKNIKKLERKTNKLVTTIIIVICILLIILIKFHWNKLISMFYNDNVLKSLKKIIKI